MPLRSIAAGQPKTRWVIFAVCAFAVVAAAAGCGDDAPPVDDARLDGQRDGFQRFDGGADGAEGGVSDGGDAVAEDGSLDGPGEGDGPLDGRFDHPVESEDGATDGVLGEGPPVDGPDEGPPSDGPGEGLPGDGAVDMPGVEGGAGDGGAEGGAGDSGVEGGTGDGGVDGGPQLLPGADPVYDCGQGQGKTIDIAALVGGGTPPYSCAIYTGPGQGTLPAATAVNGGDPSGCTLDVGFSNQLPGLYGFIVVVRDAQGRELSVPVACRNGSCNDAHRSIAPAEYPARVASPAAPYSWAVQLNDVDAPCEGSCQSCRACVSISMAGMAPITFAPDLDCGQPGDVCLASSVLAPFNSCPDVTSWSGDVSVRAHTPIRPPGTPAWLTLEMTVTYSGAQTTPCGGKQWQCHWETLEQL